MVAILSNEQLEANRLVAEETRKSVTTSWYPIDYDSVKTSAQNAEDVAKFYRKKIVVLGELPARQNRPF
jgi:hypothetical protein